MKVALLIVATGKYFQFVEQLLDSAEKYFLSGHEVNYIVFSDTSFTDENMRLIDKFPFKITFVKTPHEPWPYSTMHRYKHYAEWLQENKDFDYIYAIDADAKFAGKVGDEILKSLVGVIHCGYINKPSHRFPEGSRNCTEYYGGGFVGGNWENFYELCDSMVYSITKNEKEKIIPEWHDETLLNNHMHVNAVHSLDCSYHYPLWHDGKLLPHIAQQWKDAGLHFEPKICFLHKDHNQIRS